ncbi:MAG: dihydroorotase [Spirochaetaceae bacterium]|jgi:dihydroorotase|nr:dihydroorotase [Spirochaetaceae bacterium]
MRGVLVLKNFRVVDESGDFRGSVVVEDGIIRDIIPRERAPENGALSGGALNGGTSEAARVIDGGGFGSGKTGPLVLMPAFVDLHAHFRESGCPGETPGETLPPETLESASLAAAAGGYGTVICMANTRPVIDTAEKAARLKERSDRLGLIDLYPVLSLTKNMEGRELSGIRGLEAGFPGIRMLSEDGRDVADDNLFLAAMGEARRLGLPVSCHCDFGGPEAEAAKEAGEPRRVWSRLAEYHAVRRALALGKKAGCHIHIAHVSAKEALDLIGKTKAAEAPRASPFFLTCEAAPHHIALTEADAAILGAESYGRVNPPLRDGEDRRALVSALARAGGLIDAIATDHAPHRDADKQGGAPGFTGLETSFGVCYRELVLPGLISLSRLSALMSANPAKIAFGQIRGFGKIPPGLSGAERGPDRGRIAPGQRADLVIVDTGAEWSVDPAAFKSRGKNSPFTGQTMRGKVVMTIHQGRIVFDA